MTPSPGSSQWPESVRAAAGRCTRELTSDECYQRLSGLGLQYGPEFRGLVRLGVGTREAVAELHCPSGKSGPYHLPPNLLDSALHALAMLAALEPGANGAAPLPAAIRSVRVRGALKDRAFCHATLEGDGAGGTQLGRVQLYDPQGALAVEVEGLLLRPAGDALDGAAWTRGHVYRMAWEPRPKSGEPLSPAEPWLWIFPDEQAAREAVEALDAVGRSDPVLAWPRGGAPKAISGEPPRDGAPIEELLDSAQVERAVWLSGPLQPEDVPLECERVLALCQGAARSRSTRLLAVTSGAHDPKAPDPAQAALWGLLRTFAREHPDRWGGLLDLPAAARADVGRAVDLAMQAADAELAVFGDVVHQPRLEPGAPEGAAAPSFRADATYLLAGGAGGVGLRLARWLVERGARHLVLVGRREPSAEAASTIAELERRGARVLAVQGDVSRPQDVARALAEPHARGWPVIRGVFLLAAALADGVMHALDGQKLRVPLQAKVAGGWNLHRATAALPLDHFVLFSSIAAFGTPGQAGYAAGNAFLDALARHRKASGLPALSVGFGAFADVGAAARLEQRGGRGAPGVEPMSPSLALGALGAVLSWGEPHVVVGEFSWPAFAKDLPPGAARMYQELVRSQVKPASAGSSSSVAAAGPSAAPATAGRHLPTWLRELPRPARIEALVEHLQQQTSSLLGLPLEQAPFRDAPLMQSGLDSLMAVHLRNALTTTLEVGLSVTVVFDYPTIGLLAEHLAAALEPVPGSDETTKPTESLESLLTEIEQLPEEEVERRLRKGK